MPLTRNEDVQAGIRYIDRATGSVETEKVYGDRAIRWLYGTKAGLTLSKLLVSPGFSRLYGSLQDTGFSARKVPGFVREFGIRLDDFEVPRDGFRSFNDFFIRRFRPGKRLVVQEIGLMAAPAEARYFGFRSVSPEMTMPVKGSNLSAEALLGSGNEAAPFRGGPAFIARLCPVDYHRFHFPDDGETLRHFRREGELHSVNPHALAAIPDVFCRNERQVSILKTRNFGKLAYIEVGAMCVGRIVQSHPVTGGFRRGDEKGYFLFGGSTVVVLGEPGRWEPSSDILDATTKGLETLVRFGEPVARSL
jgi:phosphatidylserine decarboxylase